MHDPQMPMVSVAGLRVVVQADTGEDIAIVNDVNFSIEKGQVLALIGESGSGKTTIALSLMGYARQGCRIIGGKGFARRLAVADDQRPQFAVAVLQVTQAFRRQAIEVPGLDRGVRAQR